MNFIECHGKKKGDRLELTCGHFDVLLMPNNKIEFKEEGDYVLGIRPEFVKIVDKGVEGTVISSLPSGMETTLSISSKDITLSAVAFGSIDFAMDSKINFGFEGNRYVLFDKETANKITLGSLEIIE